MNTYLQNYKKKDDKGQNLYHLFEFSLLFLIYNNHINIHIL